jgi:hypothetical protein
MSASSLSAAKQVKCISSFSEAEILSGITNLNNGDQKTFEKLTKQLLKHLETVDTSKVSLPKKKKAAPTIKELLQEVLNTIHNALSEYEESDQIDEIELDFTIGVKYDELSFDAICIQHEKLKRNSNNVDLVRLLLFSEKGRMYDTLHRSVETWNNFCKNQKICKTTATRYIHFYELVNVYPRLIICKINFETMMRLTKELLKHIEEDCDLKARLQLPLRTTFIRADIKIEPEMLPQGGSLPVQQLAKGVEWNGGWEHSDIIIERKEHVVSSLSDDELIQELLDL